jgi:type I restriction enzyme R subunit
MTESQLENNIIEILETQGYKHIYGPDIAPDSNNPKRESFEQVILIENLTKAIDKLNPNIPYEVKQQAIKQILNIHTPDITFNNEKFHKYLIDGVEIDYLKNREMVGGGVILMDYDNPENNELLAINQYAIQYNNLIKDHTYSL